jgi:hypothetical protein
MQDVGGGLWMEKSQYSISKKQSELLAAVFTLCIRILLCELDRGGDRLLSFLCEFVAHYRKVVVLVGMCNGLN